MSVRTRFAPSPTGALHLGNVRAAVFNWLFARHHRGQFVLRLEDTDVVRNVDGAEQALIDDLRWLGLDWNEGPDVGGEYGPYRQSERSAIYQRAARQLLERATAYRCFCDEDDDAASSSDPGDPGYRRYSGRCRTLSSEASQRQVDAGQPFVIRIATPTSGDVVVHDVVRGDIRAPADDVDDFVLLRRDGRPTYNFAVVVDDIEMKISHVIRGSGHLSNTPKQALLFDAFGAERPVFAHLPQVLDPSGGKLSKRAGATSVAEYRAQGHLPEAIVNYLSLLGWSHPEEREVLTRDELVASISLERLGASDTAFDPEKLRWVGQQHMSQLPIAEVEAGVLPELLKAGPPFSNWQADTLREAVEVLRSRLGTFGEVHEHLHFFVLSAELQAAHLPELRAQPTALPVLEGLQRRLQDVEWNPAGLKEMLKDLGKAENVRGPGLYHPVRWAVTGRTDGPDLARILFVNGRAVCQQQVRQALTLL